MKNIIILTGNEIRHKYFRKRVSKERGINVINSYCEGIKNSLENRIFNKTESSDLIKKHVITRTQVERDFFYDYINATEDHSNPVFISKGEINSENIVNQIIKKNPDLIICYGSSLIKSDLLEIFHNRFLNVHLGLSPYYVGSGTNTWPYINFEPEYVGATFMYIDAGIDTGEVIHQIRANIFYSDNCHTIGNRLIRDMTSSFIQIINNFGKLIKIKQIKTKNFKSYKNADFDNNACEKLYKNFEEGMINKYLDEHDKRISKISIVTNPVINDL